MDPHGFMNKNHTCFVCGEQTLRITEMGVGSSGRRVKVECPGCKATGTLTNMTPWRGCELSKKRLEAIFELAGIPIISVRELPNQYWGFLVDNAYPWWFVKTEHGYIEIGWRKRVISIDWTETCLRNIVTVDEVTKSDTGVHAYSEEDAIKYLKVLGELMKLVTKPVPTSSF